MSGWRLDYEDSHRAGPSVLDLGPPTTSAANNRFGDDLESDLFDEVHSIRAMNSFCTKDNLLNAVGYINQEFQLLGLPCLKFDGQRQTFDLIFIINRIYDLLSQYHKIATVKEDLENRNHRLTCETEHLQSTTMRLKRFQDQAERELNQEREKLRQINLKYKQLGNKMKTEKEEVKRLTAVIQSRDLQQRHELKKKEREIVRLKDRLHQLLSDKAPDRKVGMDMMNLVGRTEGRRATWKTGPEKQEEEMYQVLINNYEARHCEVSQENSELRDCLLNLQRELSALLKRTGDMTGVASRDVSSLDYDQLSSDEEEESSSPSSRLSISDLNEGYFQMPYDMVRQEIEKTFKDTCNQISESMKRSLVKSHPSITLSKSPMSRKEGKDKSPGAAAVDAAEIDRLKRQIGQYKTIMKQQEDLLQQSLNQQARPEETSYLHESRLLKEKENLAEQRKLFFEEKTNFEKERQAYTEAAVRLGKERQALQEEKAKFLKEQFLNMSPFKDSSNRKTRDSHGNRLLPATPVFSPAKSNTPSRSDLYKVLGLSPSGSHNRNNSSSKDSSRCLVRLSRSSSTEARLADSQPNLDAKPPSVPPSATTAVNLENIRASLLQMSKSVHRSKSTDDLDAVSSASK